MVSNTVENRDDDIFPTYDVAAGAIGIGTHRL